MGRDYDQPDQRSGENWRSRREWSPALPVTPFGGGEEAPLPVTVPVEPAAAPAKKKRGRWAFGVLLSAMLLVTALGTLARPQGPELSLPQLWERIWPWGRGGWERAYYEYEEDWLRELEDTTVPRAPTGEGPTLSLTKAKGEQLTPQEVYQRVNPSVVGVRAAVAVGESLGTGVILSSDGYVLTNAHVIAGASRVKVLLTDGGSKTAKLVGYDGETDLAVLKITATDLPAAVFGDSNDLRVGDPAYAIGNPLGEELRGTMTDGIISAIDRVVSMDGGEMTLLQTTAALNSGNSGGALVNAYGQVVGITNMKMTSEWETIEGLGFAIPTAQAKEVVDQIMAQGFYSGPHARTGEETYPEG